MSHVHETIEIHDSESEPEFETSPTSVLPELPHTISQSTDTTSFTLSYDAGPSVEDRAMTFLEAHDRASKGDLRKRA
ncbi:hypothetical protein HanRHA438_Chr15g0729281 [Helianthus annuus]|nr:hypothetical protein HanHA300_Chr15g0584761 [Helianthus annuus]KAJ0474858.1 hypothetical protein HanHA89_Chr15g0634541 [Helianthus annuus]KAJ0650414.1 hypothetical protein HanLR1_Chr15g0595471 [Helianthus annuus]KAJ0846823.1 hypothetical protein HanRHA438_Chr15g0729281 [Helianthus annuus]